MPLTIKKHIHNKKNCSKAFANTIKQLYKEDYHGGQLIAIAFSETRRLSPKCMKYLSRRKII